MGWVIVMGIVLVGFAVGFFIVGFVVGDDLARYQIDDERLRLIEAERQMQDLTRQAFIAMAETSQQAEQVRRAQPRELP